MPLKSVFSHLHPVLARIYSARDLSDLKDLDHTLNRLLSFESLAGIELAVAILVDALNGQKRIVIVGDFDADGATSCALAVKTLRLFGAKHIQYLVPNRFEYGYGLTPEIVRVAAENRPDIIITVDNGISSIEGVDEAKRLGIQVIITDHHLPGEQLPDADVIVNPNQDGDAFPSKTLAGVGVIFYLMVALRSELRLRGWFEHNNISPPNMAHLLDYVAIGTVSDVVPLDYNNRILVSQGVERIRRGQCSAGILALIEVSGRNYTTISSIDLGFVIGPRLNAAGRLQDMSLGIDCLLCDDLNKALKLAQQLDELNKERRIIEQQMKQQALIVLKDVKINQNELPCGVCLYDKSWHQGIIGILAARIKEQVYRPIIAFAPVGNGEIKGSARSVDGVHIRDVLENIAKSHPDILSKFGGHAMAAGLSLKEENLQQFSKLFDLAVKQHVSPSVLQQIIYSDGALDSSELCLDFADLMHSSGVWGQCFPEPVFDGEFEIAQKKLLKKSHLKFSLKIPESRMLIEAIAFNKNDLHWPDKVTRIQIAYRLGINEYNGRRSVQLLIDYLKPLEY